MNLFQRTLILAALAGASASTIGARAGSDEVLEHLRALGPRETSASQCSTRIVGGECTTQKDFPWQVALVRKYTDGIWFSCGGSLIRPNWVLTAAHCFKLPGGSDNPADWIVLNDVKKMSFLELPADASRSLPKRIIVHEGFNADTIENDLALIELSTPFSAQPIDLEMAADPSVEENRDATATGWGLTRWLKRSKDDKGETIYVDGATGQKVDPRNVLSPDLMKVTVPIIPAAECAKDYEDGSTVKVDGKRNICAGAREGGHDTCQGDSGGPLVVNTAPGAWKQIGIVSWGSSQCASAHHPGVYTRVSSFGDWIANTINGSAPPPAPTPTPPPATTSQVPENDAGLTIAFDKGDDVNVGDIVSYVATTQKPGYLTIVDVSPDGKMTQIYPNAASLHSPTGGIETTRLDPSRPQYVPNYKNPYHGFNVRVAEPRGDGAMAAILSDQPLRSLETPQTARTFPDQRSAIMALDRVRGELADRMRDSSDPSHPGYSVVIRKYTVH